MVWQLDAQDKEQAKSRRRSKPGIAAKRLDGEKVTYQRAGDGALGGRLRLLSSYLSLSELYAFKIVIRM